MAFSIDTHFGRACLLESISGVYRLAAWITVERQGERHLGDQVAAICRQLGSRLGRRLWDERNHIPLLTSIDPTRHPPLAQLALTVSPRPALRVWMAGLTPTYSIEAGRWATMGSAAQMVGHSYLTVETTVEQLSHTLLQQRPDVVVVVGGYDTQSIDDPPPTASLEYFGGGSPAAHPAPQPPRSLLCGQPLGLTRS